MTPKAKPAEPGGDNGGQGTTPKPAYRRRRQKATPMWSLAELLQADRNAGTVYLALRFLAGDSRQVNTTRASITGICGLYRDGITKAINALHEAGWVVRNRGHAPGRRWYRITFPSNEPFPWVSKTSSRVHRKRKSAKASKTSPSATSLTVKNQLKRDERLNTKNQPNSLERVGASFGPAPTPSGGGGAADPGAEELRPITEWLGLPDA